MKKILFLAAVLSLSVFLHSSMAESGLQYLKIPVFARSEAMGGAYTAIGAGPESLYYNPAGTTYHVNDYFEFSAGYTDWIRGVNKESVVFVLPSYILRTAYIRAFSIDYFNIGDFDTYDAAGNKTGKLKYYDTSFAVNMGTHIDDWSLGANIKYLEESIADYKGSGYALDLGFIYSLSPIMQVGASASNLGSFQLGGINIQTPKTLRMGLGLVKESIFQVGFDLEKNENGNYLHMGGELNKEDFLLRGGWKLTEAGSEFSVGTGFSTIDYEDSEWGGQLLLNYCITFGSHLEELIHRIDLGLRFR